MDEGDRHFQGEDFVFKALRKLAARLEAIKAVGLSADFAAELNPYVRDRYLELWRGVRDAPVGPVEPWPG